MREAAYITANLFKNDHLKLLNETINQNIVKGSDQPSGGANKIFTSKICKIYVYSKTNSPFIRFYNDNKYFIIMDLIFFN